MSENITDDYDYSLSSDELDQYDDVKENIFDELEYQVRIAEERITLAGWEGATSNEIERLEDELEILMIDYRQYIEQ
jgi:hypothetical protein